MNGKGLGSYNSRGFQCQRYGTLSLDFLFVHKAFRDPVFNLTTKPSYSQVFVLIDAQENRDTLGAPLSRFKKKNRWA